MTTQIAHNAFAASELALGTLFSLTSATMIFGSLNNTRMGSRVISKLLSRPS
jgi:hypothetical protein